MLHITNKCYNGETLKGFIGIYNGAEVLLTQTMVDTLLECTELTVPKELPTITYAEVLNRHYFTIDPLLEISCLNGYLLKLIMYYKSIHAFWKNISDDLLAKSDTLPLELDKELVDRYIDFLKEIPYENYLATFAYFDGLPLSSARQLADEFGYLCNISDFLEYFDSITAVSVNCKLADKAKIYYTYTSPSITQLIKSHADMTFSDFKRLTPKKLLDDSAYYMFELLELHEVPNKTRQKKLCAYSDSLASTVQFRARIKHIAHMANE